MTSLKPSSNYWNNRYSVGRTSGAGSVDRYREWKWRIIEKFAPKARQEIIDVGCGDRSFWVGRSPRRYTGIDFSELIVRRDRERWPELSFICAPAEEYQPGLKAKVVICMDVLFHVMDDSAYTAILQNIIRYSVEWIFIYTWTENPFLGWSTRRYYAKRLQLNPLWRSLRGKLSDNGEYEKYRNFSQFIPMFEMAGFALEAVERNPISNSYGGLFVFRKPPSGEPGTARQ